MDRCSGFAHHALIPETFVQFAAKLTSGDRHSRIFAAKFLKLRDEGLTAAHCMIWGLTWGPVHHATTQQMQVNVENALPAGLVAVHHGAIARIGNTLLDSDRARSAVHPAEN